MDILSQGINFDKKRFNSDISAFKRQKKDTHHDNDDIKQGKRQKLDESDIDFFSTNVEDKTQKTKDITVKKSGFDPRLFLDSAVNQMEPEKVKSLRKMHKIKIYSDFCPAPISDFKEIFRITETNFSLGTLSEKTKRRIFTQIARMLYNLQEANYINPTAIQMQAIPLILEDQDLVACSATGSGKTVAYLLPGLIHVLASKALNSSSEGPRKIKILVIAPTKELSEQIYRVLQLLTETVGIKSAILSKSNVSHPDKPYDVLVSTPLRLLKAIEMKKIDLSLVDKVVLDEADKLFESGFLEQIDGILASCGVAHKTSQNSKNENLTRKHVQKLLFSATIDSHIENLAKTVMTDPVRVVIGQKNAATDKIEHHLIFTGLAGDLGKEKSKSKQDEFLMEKEIGKLHALKNLLNDGKLRPPVLVFTNSVERAKMLYKEMRLFDLNLGIGSLGTRIDVLHSDRSQAKRKDLLEKFQSGKLWILITTDLLGRGIDLKFNYNCASGLIVVNYDLPRTVGEYVHRVGRAGRNLVEDEKEQKQTQGRAYSFFGNEDRSLIRSIASLIKRSMSLSSDEKFDETSKNSNMVLVSGVHDWMFDLARKKDRKAKIKKN